MYPQSHPSFPFYPLKKKKLLQYLPLFLFILIGASLFVTTLQLSNSKKNQDNRSSANFESPISIPSNSIGNEVKNSQMSERAKQMRANIASIHQQLRGVISNPNPQET